MKIGTITDSLPGSRSTAFSMWLSASASNASSSVAATGRPLLI